MGHGLQMWLQVMWFLARTPQSSSVVLDEPDVYMHPDLQKRLIRLLRGRFAQTIVATHSVEMMSEVEPQQIVVVDKLRSRSEPAISLPAVQRIVDRIGSVHNLQLARLWSSRRCLFVEGDDLNILKAFQDTLFPDTAEPIDAMPNMPIGGWGGWAYAVGSSLLFKNAFGDIVTIYCVLDRDYHAQITINERLANAKAHSVQLHIWSRKEIENYLLVATTISRLIGDELKARVLQNRMFTTNSVRSRIIFGMIHATRSHRKWLNRGLKKERRRRTERLAPSWPMRGLKEIGAVASYQGKTR